MLAGRMLQTEPRGDGVARHLQQGDVATMVTYNAPRPDWRVQLPWEPYSHKGASWNQLLVESLAHVVEFSLDRASELCGSTSPVVYLSGRLSHQLGCHHRELSRLRRV